MRWRLDHTDLAEVRAVRETVRDVLERASTDVAGAVALINDGLRRSRATPARLGVCAGPNCRGTFVDLSRNGSKQYCTRACAHRVSVAAYRSRNNPRSTS